MGVIVHVADDDRERGAEVVRCRWPHHDWTRSLFAGSTAPGGPSEQDRVRERMHKTQEAQAKTRNG